MECEFCDNLATVSVSHGDISQIACEGCARQLPDSWVVWEMDVSPWDFAGQLCVGARQYNQTNKEKDKKMTFVNYIGTDHEDIRRAELIFQSDEWSHILVLGTDTVAIVPNEDIAPC